MSKMYVILILVLLVLGSAVFFMGLYEKENQEKILTVFAAASLTNVMEEASVLFKEKTGVTVRVSTASSSVLARQIESGADVDIYLSANVKWIAYLVNKGLAEPSKVIDLVSNRLVFIVPSGKFLPSIEFSKDFPIAEIFDGRLALGDPGHVPAGIYAEEALSGLGWISSLSDRLLPGANVRAALMAVESGEILLGIVYSTDAAVSDKVDVVALFPSQLHSPILYQGVILPEAVDGSDEFLVFLRGSEGSALFDKYGFGIPGRE